MSVGELLATIKAWSPSVNKNLVGTPVPAKLDEFCPDLQQIAKDKKQENNRAFVLMKYFGYLRRNPNDAPEVGLNFDGYNFWLNKLSSFNGNFINAEMVKAFISLDEYRQRFGP